MPVSYSPVPYPNPTPYQSPSQGGNQYVKPGTVGISIPATAKPVPDYSPIGQTGWNTGLVTSTGGGTMYKAPTSNGSVAGVQTQQQSTQTSSDNNSGSNGGGDSRAQELAKMDRNPVQEREYQELIGGGMNIPAGPSDEELNSAYSPIFDYLNQAQGGLQDAYNRQLGIYDTQEANRSGELATEKQNTLRTVEDQKAKAGQRKEDVLTASRRMYNELAMANRQRFGGSTSAGEAASELQSVEMQRSQASSQRAFEETMREIGNKEVEVNSTYQVNLNRIKEQVDSAKQQAYSDLQNGLLEITRQRAETESQKSQRKLQALDQYRQQLFQVQVQERQFQQQLEAWKYQQDYALQTYKQQLSAQGQGASSAFNTFNQGTTTQPTTNMSVGAQGKSQIPTYTGYKSDENLQGYAPGIYDEKNQPIASSNSILRAY